MLHRVEENKKTTTSIFLKKQKTFTYQLNSLAIFKFLLTEFGFPEFNEILPRCLIIIRVILAK